MLNFLDQRTYVSISARKRERRLTQGTSLLGRHASSEMARRAAHVALSFVSEGLAQTNLPLISPHGSHRPLMQHDAISWAQKGANHFSKSGQPPLLENGPLAPRVDVSDDAHRRKLALILPYSSSKWCPLNHFGTPILNCHAVTRSLPPHPHAHVCPFASSLAAHAFARPRGVPLPLESSTVPSMCTFFPKVRGADKQLSDKLSFSRPSLRLT